MQKYQRSFSKFIGGLKILAETTQNRINYTYSLQTQEIIDCTIEEILHQQLHSLNPPQLKQIVNDFKEHYFLPEDRLGKKSNQIVFSKDQRLLFKLITRIDINKLSKMIQGYILHLRSHNACNLVKLLRVFIVSTKYQHYSSQQIFLLMQSLKCPNQYRIFDVKGYHEDRDTEQNNIFGKDIKFKQSSQLLLLKKFITKTDLLEFIQQISKDVIFLCESGVMDYSIIFSFGKTNQINQNHRDFKLEQNKICRYGIVDFLQEYNSLKKIENRIKSIFKNSKQISSVQPQIYGKRLIEFLKKCFEI